MWKLKTATGEEKTWYSEEEYNKLKSQVSFDEYKQLKNLMISIYQVCTCEVQNNGLGLILAQAILHLISRENGLNDLH